MGPVLLDTYCTPHLFSSRTKSARGQLQVNTADWREVAADLFRLRLELQRQSTEIYKIVTVFDSEESKRVVLLLLLMLDPKITRSIKPTRWYNSSFVVCICVEQEKLFAPCRGSIWSHGAVECVKFCNSNLPSLSNCVLLTMHWPSSP